MEHRTWKLSWFILKEHPHPPLRCFSVTGFRHGSDRAFQAGHMNSSLNGLPKNKVGLF